MPISEKAQTMITTAKQGITELQRIQSMLKLPVYKPVSIGKKKRVEYGEDIEEWHRSLIEEHEKEEEAKKKYYKAWEKAHKKEIEAAEDKYVDELQTLYENSLHQMQLLDDVKEYYYNKYALPPNMRAALKK